VLHKAAKGTDVAVVNELIAAKANVDHQRNVRRERERVPPRSLPRSLTHALVMECFKDGRAPLHMVIREEIADALIQAKANVNVQQDDGATPLFVAAEHNLLPVAQKLLACDANPCLTLEVRIPTYSSDGR